MASFHLGTTPRGSHIGDDLTRPRCKLKHLGNGVLTQSICILLVVRKRLMRQASLPPSCHDPGTSSFDITACSLGAAISPMRSLENSLSQKRAFGRLRKQKEEGYKRKQRAPCQDKLVSPLTWAQRLKGDRRLSKSLPDWIGINPYADIAPARLGAD